jgi:periplasmic divalent cation tolerance protein
MHIVIFVTTANKKEAQRIAEKLIKNKLAACVNIVGRVQSLFRWQGKMDKQNEYLLIIKSRKEKLRTLIKVIKAIHSYEVPEIIALSVLAGDKRYLRWIDESLR